MADERGDRGGRGERDRDGDGDGDGTRDLSEPPTLQRTLAFWLLIDALTSVVVGAAFFFFMDVPRTVPSFLLSGAIAFSYAAPNTMVPLVVFHVKREWFTRSSAWKNFLAYVPVLLVSGTLSFFAATSLWIMLGLWPASWLWSGAHVNLLGSVALALLAGGIGFAYGSVRDELERANRIIALQERAKLEVLAAATSARLRSLESRIRPHFLFNSLNATLSLIPRDSVRAQAMVERISTLLRFSLDVDPAGLVSLREELRIAQDYLAIEKERFGDRLTSTLAVTAENDLDVQVPPFSLQTLVENSLKHAIARSRRGGRVDIAVRRDGTCLVISVTDDGPGFGARGIVAGHGLENLASRLAIHFGKSAQLSLENASPGARASFRVPTAAPDAAPDASTDASKDAAPDVLP